MKIAMNLNQMRENVKHSDMHAVGRQSLISQLNVSFKIYLRNLVDNSIAIIHEYFAICPCI